MTKPCMACGGKGFNWKVGKIVSRANSTEVATTYRQGPVCQVCHGTGKEGWPHRLWVILALVALALVLTAFVIQPALHQIFD